ncbi:MAG: hypothetical protein A9Z00_14770 [Thermobacillus sp. ZCTH02-B1]|uniref:DUF4279 domain-containing protein n=1 Tax=Thermobacillus sp. ZCTH02-B1 TaxID=1858795 RepID=UPI000B586D40|nr:DUF4279 domain-containing protein [Thermobacillus sp. ZCTH02-B1]OUM94710.1 MAG: hypothetical protein A9Z00_14770 [Thermobacillus sp. ZCTH02-B1]
MGHAVAQAYHTGHASLIIRGEALDFEEITRRLNVDPAGILRKGGKVPVGGRKVSTDFWMYRVRMPGDDPVDALGQLLAELEPHVDYIRQLADGGCDVCLRLHYQSELGQIYFEIPVELQSLIARFGVRLEFSILSWGGTV